MLSEWWRWDLAGSLVTIWLRAARSNYVYIYRKRREGGNQEKILFGVPRPKKVLNASILVLQ